MKFPDRKTTVEDLNSLVKAEYYFTGAQGAKAAGYLPLGDEFISSLCLQTFCVLVLENGYVLTGHSACADPAHFNAELGQKIAREDALDKAWPLLGFMRRTALHEAEHGEIVVGD